MKLNKGVDFGYMQANICWTGNAYKNKPRDKLILGFNNKKCFRCEIHKLLINTTNNLKPYAITVFLNKKYKINTPISSLVLICNLFLRQHNIPPNNIEIKMQKLLWSYQTKEILLTYKIVANKIMIATEIAPFKPSFRIPISFIANMNK